MVVLGVAVSRFRWPVANWHSPVQRSSRLAVAVAALGAVLAGPAAVAPPGFCPPFITGPAGLTIALDTPAGSAQPVAVTWESETPPTAAAALPQFHTYSGAGLYRVQAVDGTGGLVAAGGVQVGAANAAPYSFSATPIAVAGSLPPGGTAQLTLTMTGPGGAVPAACGAGTDAAFAWLSFSSSGGSAAAIQISGGGSTVVPLGPAPQLFQGDASGHIAISYTSSASTTAAGLDTITAANLPGGATAAVSDSYQHLAPGSSPPPAEPGIGGLTVSPRSLPRRGGAVLVSWIAHDARTCSLTASRAGRLRSSLQGIPCSAGRVSRQLRFPPDRRHHRETYRLTVTAAGVAGTTPATAQATVRVRGGAGQVAPQVQKSHLPVLLIVLGLLALLAVACAAVLLGRRYYRRNHQPAIPQQVQAVPHAEPGTVAVHRAGPGTSLVVRVEPHAAAGMAIQLTSASASRSGEDTAIEEAGRTAGQDAKGIDFADADADAITFAEADTAALADAGATASYHDGISASQQERT